MASPKIVIRISGDSKKFRKELDKIERESKKTTKTLGKEGEKITRKTDKESKKRIAISKNESDARIRNVRRVAAVLGVLAVAGITKSVIAFATFEQGLAGVSKTTNIVGKDLESLGKDITKISIALGTSSTELLEIAKSAGQLGVQGRNDIVKFTEVMAGLGKTTNITGDEGAIALARLIKVTGESTSNVDRLGSAIVDLGNNTAALENEILFTATEIAGAGKVFGITATQALGLAAAFSELAIRPELARSTILRSFTEIQKAIAGGGEEMEKLITITGLAGDELEKTFAEDATKVFALFLEGVGKLPKSEILPFLEDFNLAGLRLGSTLPKLAVASDLVKEKLDRGSKSYKENAALTKELGIQLDTTASRARQAKEDYEAISREIGEEFIPATEGALEALRDLVPFITENLVPALGLLIGFLAEAVKGFKIFADHIDRVFISGPGGFKNTPLGRFFTELGEANKAVKQQEQQLQEILEKGFEARKDRHERESEELGEFFDKQNEAKIEDGEKDIQRQKDINELSDQLKEERDEKRFEKENEELEKEQEKFDKEAEALVSRLQKASKVKDVFAGQDLLRDLLKLKNRTKNAKDLAKVDEMLSEAQQKFSTDAITTQILNLDTLFGEETAVGKAIFIVRKAQAIASAITSTQQAMALAIATVPPPGGEILAARYAIAGAINVAIIAGTAIQSLSAQDGGQVPGGFGGGDRVPILLEPGEVIVPQNLNPLSPNFDEAFGGGGIGGPQEVTVNIELSEEASQLITVAQREDTTLGVQT